ncbi:hypothetical protein HU200_041778 [Digitaria exilis]|uniref:RING-type E3 ubiquitin transferase n=1 Tax=Digitaria exilis TaxID=1010633 RepID=A0A835B3J8_9POAL|nr:hypothetical protein HU200_041778 [Digitaria exilis]
MSQRPSSHSTSSGDESFEDALLLAVERKVQENTRAISSAQPSPKRLVRGVARRIFGVATGSSSFSSPRRIPPRGRASFAVADKSESAPPVQARTGSEEETRREEDQVALTRSGYGAMMRSALADIQEDAEGQEHAPFAKLQEAMTGLMKLTYGKAEPTNPSQLPREFATRWPHSDDDLSHRGLMDGPVILASGHSVDGSYHQWSCPLNNNVYPITHKTLSHSSTAPNHLLSDMIAAWRLDHMAHSPDSTADKLSIPLAPSEEQIQDILQKFSGHSGEQPCLHEWPGLVSELLDLRKNWKSTWTQRLEEQRLGVILNLSVYRPNGEILAGENRLPVALKKIVHKLHKHRSQPSAFAKVASIVAILSEFDMFKKGILDIGGMEMLRDLLMIEDAVVRKEAVTAIRGLCADDEADALLECLMVSDEVLLVLDCLPKDPCLVDKISEKAVQLVNIIMHEQGTAPVTPVATYSAISLVHAIIQRDPYKMEQVKNLEDFKERLVELSSGRLPMQTMLQVDAIINSAVLQFW